MRGKYKNSAEARQAREGFERRATTAEHRADKAEKELAELRQTTDRQMQSLRAELSQVTRQRDDAVSPKIRELLRALGEMTAERDSFQARSQKYVEAAEGLANRIAAILAERGMPDEQVTEIVTVLLGSARLERHERSMLNKQTELSTLRHLAAAKANK